MMHPSPKKAYGFTLIEFLMYFFILGILLLTIGAIMFNVISSKVKLETIQETSQNARVAIDLIADKIRSAQSVTSPAVGATTTSLTLVMADAAKNPTIVDVASGILRIKEGSAAAVPVISNEVEVVSVAFKNVSYPGAPGSIRIALTIGSSDVTGRREYSNQETFYTTVTIRPK